MGTVTMTIAAAAQKSLASFDTIDEISTATWPSCLAVEDGRSRYKIWATNLGALHSETDRRSADYRLREAPEVTSRILELLEELTEINTEICEILSGQRTNRPLSPEDGDSSQDELSELHLSVGDTITSLFKVSILVKKATKRDRYAKAAEAKGDPFLEEFDIRHVADKYPKVRTQPWLLERLGRAITQRRQYLRYSRDHKNRIAHVALTEAPLQTTVANTVQREGNLEVIMPERIAASTTNTPWTKPTLTPTAASTLNPDQIVRDDLEDLDGDDAVSQSTSVVHSQPGAEDSSVTIPRLEDVSKEGQPFECPFCFGIVQAKKQRSWRKHVLSDIRAYVCIFQDCEVRLFEDRNSWQAHDAQCHRHRWECHYCITGTFKTAGSLESHLRSKHDVDGIPEEALAEAINSSSHPLAEVAPDCPLCDFGDQVRRDAASTGQQLSENVQVVVPLADYHRHIAHHQEQLALFAIPPAIERSVESESRNGRSQAHPDDQNQFMARWQDHVDVVECDSEEVEHTTEVATNMALRSADATIDDPQYPSMPFPHIPVEEAVSKNTKIGGKSMYVPEEGEFPNILPGDIVYIPQETGERLSYRKAVYLGRRRGGKHTAREWTTKEEVEVSMPTLIRKKSVTEEELLEAELLRWHSVPENEDEPLRSRHYRRHVILPSRVIEELKVKASQLERSEIQLDGFDEGLVRPIFRKFLQQIDKRTSQGIPLEDVVRIFYATATSHCSEDTTASDEVWKADVERSAALLMRVLIGIVENNPDIAENVNAQLREEQALMISRAKDAARSASGHYFKRYPGDLQGMSEHDDGLSFEIDAQTIQALKRRVQDAATGREVLPGFDDSRVQRTFRRFSESFMRSEPARPLPLSRLMHNFGLCSSLQIDRDQEPILKRDAEVSMHHALFLSLLISVDAQIQLERHGSAPRIRSRFTSLLMNERAKYLTSSTELQPMSQDGLLQGIDVKESALDEGPIETSTNLSHRSGTSSVSDEELGMINSDTGPPEMSTVERPPRVMKCHECNYSWTTTLASDLTDCPQCSSYSVLTESPRRTASPDHAEATHASGMTGEAALGKYFSERTDKYMNLYRREQPQPRSGTGSQDSFPDPWSHLRGSAQTGRSQPSRTPPQTGQVAEPPSKICYTCRHRFIPSTTVDTGECPQCGSDFIFTDSPWNVKPVDNPAEENFEPDEAGLGITRHSQDAAIVQIFSLIHDVEDVAAKLQQLHDRHSSNTADIPEAIDQLLCLSAGFKRLAKLQDNPQYELRLQRVSSTMRTICASIHYTLKAAFTTLRVPLDETQWMMLKFQLSTIEHADILERLRWYQASILGLLDHLDGFSSGMLLRMEENIKNLLAVQLSTAATDKNDTQSRISITGTGTSESARTRGLQTSTSTTAPRASGSADAGQPDHQESITQQLASLIDNTEEAATRLQSLHTQHANNTADLPDTIDGLCSLRDILLRLSHLLVPEPRSDAAFAKAQKSLQTTCRSMRYTLEDVLGVLSPGEPNLAGWVFLATRMVEKERVTFSERLKWYKSSFESLSVLLNRPEGESLVLRWLLLHDEMPHLLARQEITRSKQWWH